MVVKRKIKKTPCRIWQGVEPILNNGGSAMEKREKRVTRIILCLGFIVFNAYLFFHIIPLFYKMHFVDNLPLSYTSWYFVYVVSIVTLLFYGFVIYNFLQTLIMKRRIMGGENVESICFQVISAERQYFADNGEVPLGKIAYRTKLL